MEDTNAEQRLLNLHEVLVDAKLDETIEGEEWGTTTFRLPTRVKEIVDQICQTNGATPSQFLRRCCVQLVSEYEVRL